MSCPGPAESICPLPLPPSLCPFLCFCPWGPCSSTSDHSQHPVCPGHEAPCKGRRQREGPGCPMHLALHPCPLPTKSHRTPSSKAPVLQAVFSVVWSKGRETQKFTDIHLNKIFLSEFSMRCQQLFNIMLPLLADHVIAPAGGESGCQLPTGTGR